MQEQRYQAAGVENANSGSWNGLVKFLLGLFSGVAVAAPVTAMVTKKICDRKQEEAVQAAVVVASEMAENRGIQAGIAVALEESAKQAGSAQRGLKTQINGISEAQIGSSVTNRATPSGATASLPTTMSGKADIPVYLEKPDGMIVEHTAIGHDEAKGALNEAYMASLQAPEEDPSVDYDLENYNLTIDDEEATQGAAEFSEQHVQYLDMIERYKNSGGGIPPMTISRDQFDNEHFYEKTFVNWYEDDDVFEEEDSVIEDPGYLFGFTSGREMFAPNLCAGRDDPDICHIRNMARSTDFEITRMHGSYQRMVVDGEVYYSGAANSKF